MRRTATFTADTGRDKGKVFVITEMPADQAERWATRALLALANGGAKLPDETMDAGMAGMASMAGALVLSLRTLQGLSYHAVEELLDEMLTCVKHQPVGSDGGTPLPPMALIKGANCQIEEVRTFLQLRYEVLQVHTDFSLADALSSFQNKTPSPGSQVPPA